MIKTLIQNYGRIIALCLAMTSALPVIGREAGEPGQVALKVAALLQGNTQFTVINAFAPGPNQFQEPVSNTIRKYTLLELQPGALKTLLVSQPEFIRVTVPASDISNAVIVIIPIRRF